MKNEKNYWLVVPDDKSVDNEYIFKVGLGTLGNKLQVFPSSGYKKLVVGCTSSLTFSAPAGFVSQQNVIVGSSEQDVYTIVAPVPSLFYCKPIKIEIFDVRKDGISDPQAAFLSK